ncbi:hypothetical protein RclHR1_04480016 [Rhizophagus clarus]|uniref:F-box domain-containing protein n=1 Tax=Rhizophagus clarus TaxID=94130 RepID=A0A2Z6S071_9GLOM|nr:hypothetical protein RclHR1_04480016 [Rhizophagus clarus]GES77875.1 hypothetical protein GLOIN_2v1662019 [Rhizophagus clarus]
MQALLPTDCLNGIFKCLLDDLNDASSLHSCLLVNKLWCETVIPLLWNNPWQCAKLIINNNDWPPLVRTLLSCLPEDSKEILRNNGINLLLRTTSSPPLFDYVGYCQHLSPTVMDKLKSVTVDEDNKNNVNSECYLPKAYREHLVEQEFYKLFMTKCSLKYLVLPKIPLAYFPGASHCLEYLRELKCYTERPPELFYGLAHISRNLHRLTIYPCDQDNDGLITLIKLQKGLKTLVLVSSEDYVSICPEIGQALATQMHSLSSLKIRQSLCIPPKAISSFINLRILQLDITTEVSNIELLSRVILPKLEILDIFCDENAPFNTYSSLISNSISSSNSPCLKRIYWHKINLPCSEEIGQYIQILLPVSSTLRFLTVWWSEELFTLLNLCDQLETIKFCNHKDLRGNVDYLSNNLIESENCLQGKLIFELLKVLSLENLCIICLQGRWAFTLQELKEFLEFWKEQRKNTLSVYLLSFENKFKIEPEGIIREYLSEGILKDFGDRDSLENFYSMEVNMNI